MAEDRDSVSSLRKGGMRPSTSISSSRGTPPVNKLKKDENNKKVMETRKAAEERKPGTKLRKAKTDNDADIKNQKPKKIVGGRSKAARAAAATGVAVAAAAAVSAIDLNSEGDVKINERSVVLRKTSYFFFMQTSLI